MTALMFSSIAFMDSARRSASAVAVAADSSGVKPYVFLALTSAPASTSAITVSIWPISAAKCSGVRPSSFIALISAPASTSATTVSV